MSVKFFVRNSGAGNGCANYGRLEKCVLSAGKKTHVHKIPRFRWGGILGFWGGEVPILFYGREDFDVRFRIATILFMVLIVKARADLLKNGQVIGPRLA